MKWRGSLFFLWGVGGGAFVLALLETFWEIHFPGTDVFLFKEAGVNLATQGKFVATNLPHTPFGEERPFAYYPPLYPFFFGVWSWLVGVGLKQSIFFDSLLKVLRTGLMLVLIWPSLPESFFVKRERYFRWALGLFFCLLTVASTDRDRPDELAILFGLLFLITLNSTLHHRIKLLGAGFLLACVGGSSPACGIFFSLLGGAWAVFSPKPYRSVTGLFTSAMTFGVLMLFPVLLADGASATRFSKQAGISTFPYLRFLDWGSPLKVVAEQFLYYLNIFKATSPHFWWLASMLGISFLVRFLKAKGIKISDPISLWALVSVCFGLLVPIVWTLQPYYLWFPCVVLIVWLVRTLLTESRFSKILSLMCLFGFCSPFWIWEAKCFLNAIQMPPQEQRDRIKEAVLENIEPGQKLAVTHDQYFTFRNERPVANYEYWGWNPQRFDFLYVTELADSQHLKNRGRQVLSSQPASCFSLVRDFSTKTPLKILGFQTKYFVRGHGGSLLKNNCKSSSPS